MKMETAYLNLWYAEKAVKKEFCSNKSPPEEIQKISNKQPSFISQKIGKKV